MDKAHDIQKVEFIGTTMLLQVDGKKYESEISEWSERLAMATQDQRGRFEVSPAGIGLHWPDVDEDLSIDGLIGVKHSAPAAETTR
jgi:hypothetical protein